eukprot:3665170-Pyramimonas_sp.AAC.1
MGSGRRMRAVPVGASVGPPVGPRSAALGGGSHAGEPLELPTGPRNAVPGGGGACGRCHWGLVELPINGSAKW